MGERCVRGGFLLVAFREIWNVPATPGAIESSIRTSVPDSGTNLLGPQQMQRRSSLQTQVHTLQPCLRHAVLVREMAYRCRWRLSTVARLQSMASATHCARQCAGAQGGATQRCSPRRQARALPRRPAERSATPGKGRGGHLERKVGFSRGGGMKDCSPHQSPYHAASFS